MGRELKVLRAGMLAAVAGVLLLAVPATASAAHSVLCKENVSVCPEAARYPTETFVTSTLESTSAFAELELPGVFTISCKLGKVSGSTKSQVEGPLTGTTALFYFSSCSPESCAINPSINAKWSWEWTATGSGNGTITIKNVTLPVTCSSFGITCSFVATAITSKFEGGALGKAFIRDEGTPLTSVGAGCPVAEAKLRFRTVVQEPHAAVYLTN